MTFNPIYKGMENGPQAINENFQQLFAVGDIHISTSSANPADRFGGTWERFGKGKTLISVDENDTDFNAANKTGGEKTHTLTVDEMPAHNHSQVVTTYNANGISGRVDYKEDNKIAAYDQGKNTGTTGGGKKHNNLQPYITVYMWVKVA